MNKIKILLFSIMSFFVCSTSFANTEELKVETGKAYLLSFDEPIETILTDKKLLDAEIIHTIFDDNRQIILILKTDQEVILQVKTIKNLYNYNILKSDKASSELIELDIPSLENLDVDILDRTN